MYIFISHSSKDAVMAEKICNLLEENGKECFLAPRNIRSGHEYAEEIVDGIDRSDAMIILLSQNANQSPHVLREIERAVSKSLPIIIYKLEDVELTKSMEYFLMTHQWLNAKAGGDYRDILECVKNIEEPVKKKQNAVQVSGNNVKKVVYAVMALAVLITVCFAFLGGKKAGEKDDGKKNNESEEIKEIKTADTVEYGTYNNEPVSWRVLDISEDKKTALLVSEYIISVKPYDVAESGRYNKFENKDYWTTKVESTEYELLKNIRGDNSWENSNIRAWLNEDGEIVEYIGMKPDDAATSGGCNGYSIEAGFLNGFTDWEIENIVETQIVTNGSADNSTKSYTKDKVFLLSADELRLFDEAGISIYAKLTKAAKENDEAGWDEIYAETAEKDTYFWWLREPSKEWVCKNYLVSNGYTEEVLFEKEVSLEGYGIRPAMYVNLSALER